MVPDYRAGAINMVQPRAFDRAGCGMIHFLTALKPVLKPGSIFSDIMGQTDQTAMRLRLKRGSKTGAAPRGSL